MYKERQREKNYCVRQRKRETLLQRTVMRVLVVTLAVVPNSTLAVVPVYGATAGPTVRSVEVRCTSTRCWHKPEQEA